MTGSGIKDDPHDLSAEQATLGAMMQSPAAVAVVTAILTTSGDYYRPAHQMVHEAIVALHGQGAPCDVIAVADELRCRRQLGKVGDAPYLHTLLASVISADSAEYHAKIVRTFADRRELLAEAARLVQAAADPGTDPVKARARTMEALAERQVAEEAPTSPHLAAIPVYPAEALCGPLGELVTAGRDAGLHPALVGGAGLAALATVTGMADLTVRGTWTERPALWVALIAPRGAGKTPAQSYAYRVLHELDAARHRLYDDLCNEWNETPAKDRGPYPADTTRLIDDVTLEMTARWLGQSDGTGGIDVDELSGWLRRMGRYSAAGDSGERGRWLSMWSATPWRYQRVGTRARVDIRIARPVLTICGGIQPPLHDLLGGEEDGLRPRWLPHLVIPDAPLRSAAERPTPDWEQVIRDLYEARESRTWLLEARAYEAWSAARARWKRDSASGTASASVSAALDKADMQAARIALVVAESLAPAKGGPVPTEAVTAAVAITDYVLGCWRALPDREALTMSRRDETLHRGVGQLADWLEQHGGRATTRELMRAHVAGVRTADVLQSLLAQYEAEYPGSVRKERSGGRGPTAQVVYAPRRGSAAPPRDDACISGKLSPGDSFPEDMRAGHSDKAAGQRTASVPAKTVATGDSLAGDSSLATVSALQIGPGRLPARPEGAWSA